MKKALLFAVALVLSISASAQLRKVAESNDWKVVSSFGLSVQPGYAALEKSESGFYYLHMNSYNKFDPVFLFFLGPDTPSACQTLIDLEELYKSEYKNKTIEVKNGSKTCSIRKSGRKLTFWQEGYEGIIELPKSACQKFILDIGKD